ncbi:hypothetical protein SAZ11_60880 [Streptomyces sp. FXJ1.4098]|nr:hypothetical protein [Streptomyces sp. FXJ1.4098]
MIFAAVARAWASTLTRTRERGQNSSRRERQDAGVQGGVLLAGLGPLLLDVVHEHVDEHAGEGVSSLASESSLRTSSDSVSPFRDRP